MQISLDALEDLTTHFEDELFGSDGSAALSYLNDRKFSVQTLKNFRIGFYTGKKTFSGLEDHGYTENFWSSLANRLIFPIQDSRGLVRGFSGRILPGDRRVKYFNSPESAMFKKGEYLFGLHQHRKDIYVHGKAILCEGYTDVMAFHEAGLPTAIACMSTRITDHHFLELLKYTDTIYFAFDPDDAGNAARNRGLKLSEQFGFNRKILNLPNGKDPAAVLLGGGNK